MKVYIGENEINDTIRMAVVNVSRKLNLEDIDWTELKGSLQLQKRIKSPHLTKNNLNFNAYSHCTHLPLPALTQINLNTKSKECNFLTLYIPLSNNIFTE